jgi:DNA-binding beta-propeller fold protein YncE
MKHALRCAVLFCLLSVGLRPAAGQSVKTYNFSAAKFAIHPTKNILYATAPGLNSVIAIDTATLQVIGTRFTGSKPFGLSLSPDASRLYVANTGSQASAIAVIDTATFTALPAIPLTTTPLDIAAGNDNRLYISSGGDSFGSLLQVDAGTGVAAQFGSSYDNLLQISPDRNTLFTADEGLSPGTLMKYDVSTATPQPVWTNPFASLGSNGEDLKVSHDGSLIAYLCGSGNADGYDTALIRTSDMLVLGTLDTDPYPEHIAFSPDDRTAYTSDRLFSPYYVKVWDTTSFFSMGTIPTDGEAVEMAVDPSGRYLFVSFQDSVRVYRTGAVLSGKITLQGCVNPAQTLTLTLSPQGEFAFYTRQVTLAADGTFALPGIPYKAYDIRIKGAKWLAKTISVDATGGDVSGVTAMLLPGDINDDNRVDIADLGLLADAFNSTPARNNWNPNADLNCDGKVNISDLGLLADSFGRSGDP